MAPALGLEPPGEVEVGTEEVLVLVGWLTLETTDGAVGVTSGSLPAAIARTGSNVLICNMAR